MSRKDIENIGFIGAGAEMALQENMIFEKAKLAEKVRLSYGK